MTDELMNLINNTEKTELDRTFDERLRGNLHSNSGSDKNEEEESNPIIVAGDPADDGDSNIKLSHRQPSFSSLDNKIIVIKGESAKILNEEPLDEEPELEDDAKSPVKSPNNSSLSPSPNSRRKGPSYRRNSSAVCPLSYKPFCHDKDNSIYSIFKDVIFKDSGEQLDLIKEKIRAQSQHDLLAGCSSYTPMSNIVGQIPDPLVEAVHDNNCDDYAPSPIPRKRSNSFGTDNNEKCKSIDLKDVLPSCDEQMKDLDEGSEHVEDDNEEDDAKPEHHTETVEYDEDQDDEKDSGTEVVSLTGNLLRIVKEGPDSCVYQALLKGEIEIGSDYNHVTKALTYYRGICSENMWHAEVDYITEILNKSKVKKKRQCTDECAQLESMLRYEIESRDLIIKIHKKCKKSILDDLDREYLEEASQMDAQWFSPETLQIFKEPSKTLIEMRSRLSKLKQSGDKDEYAKLEKEYRKLYIQESREANKRLKMQYQYADKSLKERFVSRRVLIIRKYDYLIDQINRESQLKINTIHKEIVKLKEKKC